MLKRRPGTGPRKRYVSHREQRALLQGTAETCQTWFSLCDVVCTCVVASYDWYALSPRLRVEEPP